jgi:uridine kinase
MEGSFDYNISEAHIMAYLLAIGGGSGSGKTFIAKELAARLGSESSILSYDSYYRDQSTLSMEERKKVNYDDPKVLDEELFLSHLAMIKRGESVLIPCYNFSTHTRKKETLLFKPTPIVIVEGIMVYAVDLQKAGYDYKIYVDAESDIRLARRIVRDEKERGRSGTSVIEQYLASVRPMHKKYVEVSKKDADFVFLNDENNGLDQKEMDRLLVSLHERFPQLGLQ